MVYCPCFLLRIFSTRIFCWWEGVLGIWMWCHRVQPKKLQLVSLSVCSCDGESFVPIFAHCGIICKTVTFISLFEYRKPFLIIWIEFPVPCDWRFLVAGVLVADEVHFPKICFMANATPDLTPRHVYQALPVGCAHFSPSLNTPTDNRLAGDRFWRVLCVFNWLIVFCWFLSKKKKGFSRWAVGMEQRTVAIIVFIKSYLMFLLLTDSLTRQKLAEYTMIDSETRRHQHVIRQ